MSDHNAGYRWHDVKVAHPFAVQRNELNDMRLVRLIRPDNADAMVCAEVIADGNDFDAVSKALGLAQKAH